jgi:hypothetical protein
MKANLRKIIEQLELCQFTCDGGALENNTAFVELKRIAEDAHDIAACLANAWIETGISRSQIWIAQDEIDGNLEGRTVKVTIEWGKDNDTLPE